MKISTVFISFIVALIIAGIFALPSYAQRISEQQAMNSGTTTTWNIPYFSEAQGNGHQAAEYLGTDTFELMGVNK